jgi:hypothetical protein
MVLVQYSVTDGFDWLTFLRSSFDQIQSRKESGMAGSQKGNPLSPHSGAIRQNPNSL